MSDELGEKLKAILRDLGNQRHIAANNAHRCVEALNTYIRPAIKQVCDELKNDRVSCFYGNDPHLSVARDQATVDELQFKCDGVHLIVLNTRKGQGDPYEIDLDDISHKMIAGIIDDFLRSTLGLKSPYRPM